MWLGLAIVVIAIAAVIAGAFAGGIFTIVLIPLAALAVIALFISWLWGRATNTAGAGATTNAPESAPETSATIAASLPRSRGSAGAHVPTSPERLADARREQQ
jgi:hypothetical protein